MHRPDIIIHNHQTKSPPGSKSETNIHVRSKQKRKEEKKNQGIDTTPSIRDQEKNANGGGNAFQQNDWIIPTRIIS